jgi:hypothetical protein
MRRPAESAARKIGRAGAKDKYRCPMRPRSAGARIDPTHPGRPMSDREFWQTGWDAMYDDESGPHINRPEMLGPLLQMFLGLPL